MKRCYIKRWTDDNPSGGTVELPEDVWIRIGQTIAEEIKRGRAHFIPEPQKRKK